MRAAVAIAVATTLALATPAALLSDGPTPTWAASPKDRRFVSAKHGIGVEAPTGWALSLHTGYPSIIVLMIHPNGSRISISVSDTTAQTARELVDRNRRGLEAQKLTVIKVSESVRDGIAVDARAQGSDEVLRQIYLVRALTGATRQAIVMTLTTRADVLPVTAPSLDLIVGRLTLDTPTSVSADGGADTARRD